MGLMSHNVLERSEPNFTLRVACTHCRRLALACQARQKPAVISTRSGLHAEAIGVDGLPEMTRLAGVTEDLTYTGHVCVVHQFTYHKWVTKTTPSHVTGGADACQHLPGFCTGCRQHNMQTCAADCHLILIIQQAESRYMTVYKWTSSEAASRKDVFKQQPICNETAASQYGQMSTQGTNLKGRQAQPAPAGLHAWSDVEWLAGGGSRDLMVLPCTEAATIGSLTHCFRRRSLQGTSLDEQVKMPSDHSAHELVFILAGRHSGQNLPQE